jgi:RNA polymerase sigma factor (sigma-70 family)
MATGEDYWQRLIHGLRTGDREVVQEFVRQYGSVLQHVAERHLPRGVRQRVGPEDVVQSACRTFLRRAQGGEFHLDDSEGLWRLLCAITLTKAREQTRFHLRKKRSLERELPLAGADSGAQIEPAAAAVSPLDAAAFADQFQKLVGTLNDEEQQVLDLKLQDFTNDDVATRLSCSERTVRRILKRVQSALTTAFDVRESQPDE